MHQVLPIRTLANVFRFTLAISAILVVSSVMVFAQVTKGTLRGTVTDPNGGVVGGATVSAQNQNTGATTQTTTSSEGNYVLPELAPGQYTVTVEATSGFSKKAIKDVTINLGQSTDLPVALAVGSPTEVVTVTSTGEELITRDQSQVSTTIETRKVEELPSNAAGSGLDTLALLAPGVIANNSGGVNTNGTGLSVNGNRARSNNFQIDGADNNDLSVSGPAMFIDNQDSVQEIQVITNNFSAQYGRNQGAIVNYVTKAGTNQFHGSLFEFHRDNRNLISLDNIEKRGGQEKPNRSLFNVFGGTVGGPLYLPRFGEGGRSYYNGTDRLFFFVSYQGIRNPSTTIVRTGSFSFVPAEFQHLLTTFPGNGAIQAITTQSVFALPGTKPRTDVANPFATVTLGGQNFQVAQSEFDVPNPFNETQYSTRFDLKVTKKDVVTVRYEYQKQDFVNSLAQTNGFTGDIPASSKNFGGIWTRTISNSMVSEFRAFYQRIGVEFGGGCGTGTSGCIPGPLDIGSALTNITLPVLSGRTMLGIGPATNLPQGRIGKVYQVADNLSWTKGKHSFIFGGEYKHLNEVSPFLPNFNGQFGFNSAARLTANAPSTIGLTVGDPTLAFTEDDQYYFVQDDFKIRPNLTLNLGVRYEYTGQPINILNQISTERETNPATAFYNPALPLSVRTVPTVKADKNNFAPRVGFAYTPHFWTKFLGEDATVIRGGFSIAYEPAFYNILGNVQGSAPFSAATNLGATQLPATNSPFPLPAGGNPTGVVIRNAAFASGVLPLGQLNPLFLTQTQVSKDFHAPYSEQWSLGVQHQFGRNHVAEVRYVGTHGVGLFQNINGNFFTGPLVNGIQNWFGTGINLPSFSNLLPPGTTAQVCTDVVGTAPNEGLCNGRQFRQAGVTVRSNTAFSSYNALQSRYTGRFFNNSLSLNASYTWSKTIDNASEIFGFDIASPNQQNPFCNGPCERSLSQIDRPHAFSLNFIYDVPFMKEQHGLVGHLLGGWQVNGVYVFTSGEPYTPGQFFNGSVYGLGNTYLTSGDRPFIGNPNADPKLVGISQTDAFLIFDAPLTNPNGFYSFNQINATGNFVPVTPNDVHFIANLPGAATIFGTPFGNSTRNSLRGPRLNQLNASLFKNIKIKENLSVQLRGEAYNVLNHPNPGYGVNVAGYLPDFFVEDAGVSPTNFADHGDIELSRRVIQVGIRIIF
jgi:outer membrane receptor protein involved in Fe transport